MMFITLLKKQLYEVFKGCFYNTKNSKSRSVAGTIALLLLFALLTVGFIGGSVTLLFVYLCPELLGAKCGWLYYAFAGGMAVVCGTLGGVFSTYSALYLSKDNDLLFSMPIRPRTIVLSRLFVVYLLGLFFSGLVTVPATIVYYCVAPFTVLSFFGGIAFIINVSILVLVLACGLGYVVAKLSIKLKNKSYITVIISLLFITLYYIVYFKASEWISAGIQAVVAQGETFKDKAYFIYLISCFAEGNVLGLIISTAVHAGLFALIIYLITRSFIKITSKTNEIPRVKNKAEKIKQKSAFGALLAKEGSRFVSNATYMLNSSFGLIVLGFICIAVFLLKNNIGAIDIDLIKNNSGSLTSFLAVAAMCFGISGVATVVPSVSLEGKSLWIIKCLPFDARLVLKAKAAFQIILTAPFALAASLCSSIALAENFLQVFILFVIPQIVNVLNAEFGLILSVKMANLNWSNEIVPIKQNLNVLLAPLGSWLFTALIFVPYFIFIGIFAFEYYALMAVMIMLAVSYLLYRYAVTGLTVDFKRI